MDYEFTHEPTGEYRAEFSMDHEAMGYWLINELGNRQTVIDSIFNAIKQLQQNQCWDYEREGTEYNLLLNRDEATVRAHALDSSFEDELETDLDFYDDESTASCGLEDFIDILKAWQHFINKQ